MSFGDIIKMNSFRLLIVTILGVAFSQIIAMVQVYVANGQLSEQVKCLKAHGYMVIPNIHVLPYLERLSTAFFGGLFFTFTIGLGIVGITYFLSWFWISKSNKSKLVLLFIIAQWIVIIFQANLSGFSSFNCYLLILAPVIFILNCLLPISSNKISRRSILFWIIPILFVVLFISFTDKSISFISIRDYLLLSNKIGNKINSIYYKYTLYPSEIIKPYALKQQKTCYISLKNKTINNRSLEQKYKRIKRKCIEYDYLIVSNQDIADLVLSIENDNILLKCKGRTVLKTNISNFLKKAKSIFKQYSEQTDTNQLFRYCIFLSLIIGAPLIIYIIFMNLLFSSMQMIKIADIYKEFIILSIICLGLFFLIIQIPSKIDSDIKLEEWQILFKKASKNKDWKQGIELLKSIKNFQIEKNNQIVLDWLKQTQNYALKYWLVRFFVKLPKNEVPKLFYDLLKVPQQVNVTCQLLYVMGKQKDRKVIPKIREVVNSTHSWYIQMYGYRSLKRLGWVNFPQSIEW